MSDRRCPECHTPALLPSKVPGYEYCTRCGRGSLPAGAEPENPRANWATDLLVDIEKINTATARGWRVVRATPQTLCSSVTLDLLRHLIP